MNNQQFSSWRQQLNLKTNQYQSPLIMGIINVTPDSFSDGGRYLDLEHAFTHAQKLLAEGVDILDIGGESSRPGAKPISVDEEIARVIPLIKRLRHETDCCISVDTTKAAVMQAAIEVGADLVNDITALRDKDALNLIAKLHVPVCLMHMKGIPETMQALPISYKDIIAEVNLFFQKEIERCLEAGIQRHNIIIDPGFGFSKTVEHNLCLVKDLSQFKRHNLPIMLGVSRKSTIGAILNKNVDERLIGGTTLNIVASLNGVNIIRTHDVTETKQALVMLNAIMQVNNNLKGKQE
ncbi:dihydropteroate synthase [Legionella busanensis]|uniref:Dihydropteroate synthase n=1 Tax=Legionella busanensis TaxID=190655 RepID=A0A378JX25_9GAMM|nr:dihydropteroate synthase [Legionella busanensis]STX52772.1 dihydropteroate synthase [Legionella busanensis]